MPKQSVFSKIFLETKLPDPYFPLQSLIEAYTFRIGVPESQKARMIALQRLDVLGRLDATLILKTPLLRRTLGRESMFIFAYCFCLYVNSIWIS